MGLRFLALLVLFGVAVFFVQRFIQKHARKRTAPKAVTSRATVRCERCGLYVPSADAVEYEGRYYCSYAHLPDQAGTGS